jgi:23S rRNA (adenine2503-C2)-methyltransferase
MMEIGEPRFRAKQVFSWLSSGTPIAEMTNLSKALREKLSSLCVDTLPKVEKKLVSQIDGTVKYLFALHDGECVESVLMRYKHGNTLCISSQVGCRMGCRFCASTIGGRVRDLMPSELLGQVIAAERDSGERISNIVMMGIGEPLDNYDNVIRFLQLVNDKEGLNIGYRHISLSTCGVVPGIRRLAEEALPITLSISLHASDDETRSALMPVNKKWPIAELLSACVDYYKKTRRRISFEYTLIAGKNDTEEGARALAALLKNAFRGTDAPLHVNLIRVNAVEETGMRQGSVEGANRFAEILNSLGVVATVRRRLGSDVNAACGQLRRASGGNKNEN